MTELVTKAECYEHLRLDSASYDAWLTIFIPAISGAVLSWLKDEWRAYETEVDAEGGPILDSAGDEIPVVDSDGDMTPRPLVKAAVLVELARIDRFRDGSGKDGAVPESSGHGYILGAGATALLSGLRKSTVR